MAAKSQTIRVADGGALSASLSSENVEAGNYVRKLNLRREGDQDIRREGWKLFKPDSTGADAQSVFDGTEAVRRLAELVRPNGDRVVVGAGRTTIKKFDTATGLWTVIGSGFSSIGRRWQAETINGYLVLNNTENLLVTYRVEETAVVPIYELRDNGVAKVGRIVENNGFLLVGDITEIQEDQLDTWMRGYADFPVGSTVTKAADFTVLDADSGKLFDVTTGATNITATIPTTPTSSSFFVWLRKADAGAGHVLTLPTVVNQAVALAGIGDKVLVWWNPVNKAYGAKVFIGGVVPATDPYGPPPTDILNHKPWKVMNSEFGQPRNWAPAYSVVLSASTATLTIPFATDIFVAGKTRVAVVNGGPDGGTLGGQDGYENGILVTDVAGRTLTLEKPTDAGLVYPRTVEVTRWSDVSTLVASYDLQGDGSPIVSMGSLQNLCIVYRTTGIYVGRYAGLSVDANGNTTGPFIFRERYQGKNVPRWGDCVVSVKGDYHLYPSRGNRFYQFDGVSEPTIHKQCDLARRLFFTHDLSQSEECWAIDNPATSEVWIIRPGILTMAFDYMSLTVSEIDVGPDAAAYVTRPGNSLDKWFILGIDKVISTYGLVEGDDPFVLWLRNGVAANWRLKSGLISLGDQSDEKDVLSYTPILASESPDYALDMQLYSTYDPAVAPVALLTPPVSMPDPDTINYIPLFFRNIYFQLELVGTDVRDIDFRLSAHVWEFDKLTAMGVPRRNDT